MARTFENMRLFTVLNALEITGISVMLYLAFSVQFMLHELPCPLCLMQRVGFFGVCLSLLLNLRFGFRPSHYGMAVLFALFSMMVALRQIALNMLPGETISPVATILGFHLYTWSFIFSVIVLVYSTIILACDIQYEHYRIRPRYWQALVFQALFILLLLLIVGNMLVVFLECGFGLCPENPTHYFIWR